MNLRIPITKKQAAAAERIEYLTRLEADILEHTSTNGRYVMGMDSSEWPAIYAMVARGWLFDYGAQALAGGAHYLVLTTSGRERLREHFKAMCVHPQPRPLTRRQIAAKERWREYSDSGRCDSGVSFREFLTGRRLVS